MILWPQILFYKLQMNLYLLKETSVSYHMTSTLHHKYKRDQVGNCHFDLWELKSNFIGAMLSPELNAVVSQPEKSENVTSILDSSEGRLLTSRYKI